jgi:hypothetical protein
MCWTKEAQGPKRAFLSEGTRLESNPSIGQEGTLFAVPVVPIGLSTYLSKASYDGRLFDQSTYTFETFQAYMDRFAEDVLGTIRMPESFSCQTTLKRFQDRLRLETDDLKKLIESTKAKDTESVKKMIKRVRTEGHSDFDRLIEYVREGEFPPLLWLELDRVKFTFVDSLEFLVERLDKLVRFAPKSRSQSRQRNDLTQRMSRVVLGNVFIEFTKAFTQLYRLLLFIEIWSCENENELFTNKPWRLRNVDQAAFDEVFMSLHASISSLRQAYFLTSGEKHVITENHEPVPWAIRELVKLA